MQRSDAPFGLPCGWLRLDATGHIVAANDVLRHLVERTDEQLCGQAFDALLTPPARVVYQSYLQPLLRLHGNVAELALTLRQHSGVPLDVLVYTVRSVQDSVAAVDMVLVPIRQRRRIDDELLRIKRAADLSPGLIFQLRQELGAGAHFDYTSEALRTLYGISANQAQQSAEAVFNLMLPEDRKAVEEQWRAAAAVGAPWHSVYRVPGAGGRLRWHELRATPRVMGNGTLLWHGHIADITERREFEASQSERLTLQRLHEARIEFLARVSHELRTPLNGIVGFAQLLARDEAGNLRQDQADRLRLIQDAGSHLRQLVDQVLDLTLLEAGQLTLDVHPCALAPQLHQAVALEQPQAALADVSIHVQPAPDALAVMANPLRLQQVLLNLLSNAIKFSHPGGRVLLSAAASAGEVRIQVEDEGVGMTEEQLQSIFQPFNRLGAERTARPGVGLGLSICKGLLESMGGTIGVSSSVGRGSHFSVTLPRATLPPVTAPAKTVATTAATTAAAGVALASTAAALRDSTGRSLVVLYVEDNPVNAILMEGIVNLRPRVALHVATDAASALALLESLRPDLLLLDMHLPDADGVQLLASIRQRPGLAAVPAVVVSAAAQRDDIERAKAHGFVGYWTKPLDVQRTLGELDGYLTPPG